METSNACEKGKKSVMTIKWLSCQGVPLVGASPCNLHPKKLIKPDFIQSKIQTFVQKDWTQFSQLPN